MNDRGPFVNSRIIDLSRRAAQVLGFRSKGLSRVKVEIMAEQSRRMAAGREGTRPPGGLVIVRDPKPVRTASIDASRLARFEPRTQTDAVPAAAADGSTRYYVQAGAFRNHANAVGLQSWLAPMGKVSIVASDTATPIYRVRIGPYADAAAARALLKTILVERRPDAWVVSD